jgi:hypothetical protein
MRMFKIVAVVLVLLSTPFVNASVKVYNYDGADLGSQSELKCSGGLSCSVVGGQAVAEPSGIGSVETASATTITSSQCGASFLLSSSTGVEMDLPTAANVVGCRLTFVMLNAATSFTIDPASTDQIMSMTNAIGDAIRSGSLGTTITLQAISSTQWIPVGASIGVWADVN